jgi:hypothetical protein
MSLKIKFETLKEKLLSCPDTRKEYEDLDLEYDQWERLDKLAKEMNLGKFDWDEWKSYRDEGKR